MLVNYKIDKFPKAFSLIELMVVIAIVALLAAVAVPTYKSYAIKSAITPYTAIISKMGNEVLDTLNRTGSLPSSISYAGNTITNNNTWQCISGGGYVYSVRYGTNTTDQNFYIALLLRGGIFNQIDNSGIAGSCTPTNNGLWFAWKAGSSVVKKTCGFYSGVGDSQSLQATYLPANCTCTSIDNYTWTTGTPSGCN